MRIHDDASRHDMAWHRVGVSVPRLFPRRSVFQARASNLGGAAARRHNPKASSLAPAHGGFLSTLTSRHSSPTAVSPLAPPRQHQTGRRGALTDQRQYPRDPGRACQVRRLSPTRYIHTSTHTYRRHAMHARRVRQAGSPPQNMHLSTRCCSTHCVFALSRSLTPPRMDV